MKEKEDRVDDALRSRCTEEGILLLVVVLHY
jgi:hypothetical protein